MKKNKCESVWDTYMPNALKLVRIMKLTTFLLFISVFSVFASETYSQSKKLNLDMKRATVLEVLNQIEAQSEFYFMYSPKIIDVNKQVSVNIEDKKINDVLETLFADSDVEYFVKDRIIVLTTKENLGFDPDMAMQQKAVSGIITDESGQPLPGVTVMVKGTSQGTVTNADGTYTITNVPDGAVLHYSFVGMKDQEIEVGDQSSINVVLQQDSIGLDEVVAIGYGTMKKSDITGSVASVNMESLKNQPVRNLSDMLSGRVAGMNLSRTSGDIGSPTKIRVRGPNSISGSNEPLTVVDGVIGAPIGPIQDVESIEVLKDASATAIYGERASNGVILVTTKKATSGEPVIRLSLTTGFSYRNIDYPDKMNAAEYAAYINDFNQAQTFSNAEIEEFRKTGGTDWLDAITQVGLRNDHQISYSQKLDKLSVYLSGRYNDEEGTMINTKSGANYSLRSKIGFQPSKRLTMDLDITAAKSQTKNGGLSTGTSKADPFFQALIWSPTEPIWLDEENGIYNNSDHFGALLDSPYMNAMEQNKFSESHNVTSLLNANYKIADFLTYTVTGFAAKSGSASGDYRNVWLEPNDPYGSRGQSENFNWRLINKIDFNKTFADAHNIILTGVYEAEASESWSLSGTGKKMPLPDLASFYTIGLSNEQSVSSGYGKTSRIAYMGRLNYNYKQRYYFTASYRVDGKSGPANRVEENKFGAFPSFAASWRLSEEPFMKANGLFDNLKFRAGWGQTGNPCPFVYTVMKSNNYDYGIGADILGYIPGTPANPYLKWETTTQIDLGLDVTTFNGKLSVSIDYFDKLTKDLLTLQELPVYFGYATNGSYLQNLGEVSNKGFEFTVDYKPVQTQNFFWDVNFNLSTVKNKVLDLGDQAAFMAGTNGNGFLSENTYRVEEDLPLGTIWGYKYLGIWQESEAEKAAEYGNLPGDYKYEDVNNDGAYNLQDDGQAIGDANPDFIWALNNSVSYNNFDFSLLLQGMHGQDLFNLARAAMSTVHADSRTIMLKGPATDYWTPTNTDAEYKNIHSTSDAKRLNSSQWIENGSWVKVKYVGLTYNLPKEWIRIGTLALTVSAQELLTFTKYKGLDPEVSASGSSDLWGGCDFGTQPLPTTVSFGVSLQF
ncbi:MAG: TonB-dependent receptor [Draconibacterium sp.]